MPPYCPEHGMFHRYYGEHGDMRRAALAAERDAKRRDTAADIADTLIRDTATEQTDPQTRDLLRETAYAAALQALTQKETDR